MQQNRYVLVILLACFETETLIPTATAPLLQQVVEVKVRVVHSAIASVTALFLSLS